MARFGAGDPRSRRRDVYDVAEPLRGSGTIRRSATRPLALLRAVAGEIHVHEIRPYPGKARLGDGRTTHISIPHVYRRIAIDEERDLHAAIPVGPRLGADRHRPAYREQVGVTVAVVRSGINRCDTQCV